jgi:DNA-binding transcriptional MerR regulator
MAKSVTKKGGFKKIKQAAAEIGVSQSTLRRYMDKGILRQPPRKYFGTQNVHIFSDGYIRYARAAIAKMRKKIETARGK